MGRKIRGQPRRGKHGSGWVKHRRHVSRWLETVLANMPRPKTPRVMYESVLEAFKSNRK